MNCSTPSLPVHHQLLKFTQIHVHQVYDAIQPSHPLSSPSPPAFNLSQQLYSDKIFFFLNKGCRNHEGVVSKTSAEKYICVAHKWRMRQADLL